MQPNHATADEILAQVAILDRFTARLVGATGARRAALLGPVLRQGAALAHERDTLWNAIDGTGRLARGWDALSASTCMAEDERYVGLLHAYTTACAALVAAQEAI